MRRTLNSLLVAASVMVLLGGCATSPAPRFYRLSPADIPAAPSGNQAAIIGPFRFADYLDRPQIVSRDGSHAVTLAEFERWAEPLEENFQGVLAANVSRLLGSERVLEFPAQPIMSAQQRVTGRVSRFDTDERGLAVLEVQWGILDENGAPAKPARRSRYEARASGPGYTARVSALNETVVAFSKDVADALR